MALNALAWVGGKSVSATQGTGRWIAGLLPDDTSATYVEPFAGMLGVLLQRPKATVELVNDTNGRIVNWWRCLRDQPDELLRLVAFTPNSRDEFEHAADHLDDLALPAVVRAAHFTTVVRQSVRSSDKASKSSWRRKLDCNTGYQHICSLVDRLALVAERICDVQIENVDAVELLSRIAGNRVVVYCDPPYRTVRHQLYEVTTVNVDAMTEVLKAQSGHVAISGYGAEWDHLGWSKHTYRTVCSIPSDPSAKPAERTEVLWTNYEPTGQSALF